MRPGIGLALGGGFARGYAHLGVLRVLEDERIPIFCVSGSSIGSILAAAYASGTPLPQIVAKCREIRFRDFSRWRASRFGLASNERLGALVHRFHNAAFAAAAQQDPALLSDRLAQGKGGHRVLRLGFIARPYHSNDCSTFHVFCPLLRLRTATYN